MGLNSEGFLRDIGPACQYCSVSQVHSVHTHTHTLPVNCPKPDFTPFSLWPPITDPPDLSDTCLVVPYFSPLLCLRGLYKTYPWKKESQLYTNIPSVLDKCAAWLTSTLLPAALLLFSRQCNLWTGDDEQNKLCDLWPLLWCWVVFYCDWYSWYSQSPCSETHWACRGFS